jgi:type I restriction enzyme S subunit
MRKKNNHFEITNEAIKNGVQWTPKNFYPLYENTIFKIKNNYKGLFLKTEVLDIKNGEEPGSDYYVDYLNKNQNDLPFIRTSDLINHQIDLFPDNFIPYDIANDFMIDLKEGDVLFTKDGKIGSTGMVVKNDLNLAVLSAGISRIRLKKNSIITPEFLFLALTIKEIGFYQADKKTVVASTLPHLKESQILNFIIPQLDKISTNKITDLIKKAFYKKNECKNLINNILNLMDNYYSI